MTRYIITDTRTGEIVSGGLVGAIAWYVITLIRGR